jgi:hypothetical protein
MSQQLGVGSSTPLQIEPQIALIQALFAEKRDPIANDSTRSGLNLGQIWAKSGIYSLLSKK